MFNLRQFPFDKSGEKEVYGKVIIEKENLEDSELLIHITLLNNTMLEYDYETFRSDYNDNYLPYFYEFYAECKSHEICGFIKEHQNEWLIMSFDRNSEESIKGSCSEIQGYVYFAGDYIDRRGITLVITDKAAPNDVKDKIFTSYDTTKDVIMKPDITLLEKALNPIIPDDISNIEVATFNVGQGHCSYIIINAKTRILYDVGFTKHSVSKSDYIKKNITIFKSIQANAVILSHWDLDHILGAAYMNNDIYQNNTLWIAPDLNSTKVSKYVSASRLCKYLSWNPNTILMMLEDKLNGERIFSNKLAQFQIWKGKGNAVTLNEANNYGLLVDLKLKSNMLLTGDCEYSQMPDDLLSDFHNYDHFIVPHHCSDLQIPISVIKAFKKISILGHSHRPQYAIVSTGYNTYHHPYWTHAEAIINIGFDCCFTGVTDFYLIDLSK